MKDFESAKASIDANISQNGNQDISGSRLNSVLTDMIEATEEELSRKIAEAITNTLNTAV